MQVIITKNKLKKSELKKLCREGDEVSSVQTLKSC